MSPRAHDRTLSTITGNVPSKGTEDNGEPPADKVVETRFNALGLVEGYCCPNCHGDVKPSHEDDVGTKFFRCQKCGQVSCRLKSKERLALEREQREIDNIQRPVTPREVSEILDSTIKHDTKNKTITFLTMLLTYTREDQINIAYTAESSTGKSYIPLELAWYHPKACVIYIGYASPTAFFHDYGVLLPDPTDQRDVEEEKKRKIVRIDLSNKILIFLDQPHDLLLQRLRPLLSHDRETIMVKITDKRSRALRTKTVVLKGFPLVLFCTAKFSQEEQERTRLMLLSPETTQPKLRDAILVRIWRDGDRTAFRTFMESDTKRVWLRERVARIAWANIQHIVIPEAQREQIACRFFEKRTHLIPRHQRDVGRLLALIKAHALLNLWHREERLPDTIMANTEDVEEGFKLYEEISTANELGLPPEVYNIYEKLTPEIGEIGVTRQEFQRLYYERFRHTIGKKRLREVLSILTTVGLLVEDVDPNDRRQKRVYPCQGVYIPNTGQRQTGNQGKLYTLQQGDTPTSCWICLKPLPEGLADCTTVEGKPCHIPCAKKLKDRRSRND
jgi:hypothetical protein